MTATSMKPPMDQIAQLVPRKAFASVSGTTTSWPSTLITSFAMIVSIEKIDGEIRANIFGVDVQGVFGFPRHGSGLS